MEARSLRAALLAASIVVSMGARSSTPNFIVETPNPRLAQQFAQAAEKHRRELAVQWLGKAMPEWSRPCLITVRVGPHLGAGGATSFVFDGGEVFGWRMTIQGPAERILDSVLPHEITHMIFASHFRRPLPRWADEGGASSVEHVSERTKHRKMLVHFLRNGRGIAFNRMFAIKEYPPDVMPLYAQGYSLAEFLIQKRGKRAYVDFLGDGLQTGDWSGAVRRHYKIADAGALQNTWLAWVRQGSPRLKPAPKRPEAVPEKQMLAAAPRRKWPEPNLVIHVPKQPQPSYAPGSVIPAGDSGHRSPLRLAAASSSYRSKSGLKELPASAWHTAGSPPPRVPATAPTPPPVRSQVTRPQPFQRPRQTPPNRVAPGG
ncbi:MAG: hypothetical protein ACYSWU_03295 [Planctomycetota bacterium]